MFESLLFFFFFYKGLVFMVNRVKVGDKAPDFILTDVDNRSKKLKSSF